MRNTIALAALAAAVLPAAASQAQTVDICDRTPEVRYALLEALDACRAPSGGAWLDPQTLGTVRRER